MPSVLRLVSAVCCFAFASVLIVPGCYSLRSSQGGGEVEVAGGKGSSAARSLEPGDVALPPGYRIEIVAAGLNMPSGVAFDSAGQVFVVESGYAYGETFDVPRVLALTPEGERKVIASGANPPWTGVAFQAGNLYVAEGGAKQPGRILRVSLSGEISVLVDDLPSGDHHTNGPVFGPDGKLYFAQGTMTNSGVVGVDNFEYGWLSRRRELHDIACQDVTLSGVNYTSADPLAVKDARAVTGAFVAFGTETKAGQQIKGAVPCSGAVLRMDPAGGALELVAWGFRNPFGMAFAPDAQLYLTDNMYDERGSRPVYGAGDYLWHVQPGAWYGWPDYAGGRSLAMERYAAPGGDEIAPLLAQAPGVPPRPAAELGVHSSSSGLDFSRNPAFGHVGEAFIAQFGDMAPKVGKVLAPVGFKVVRVDRESGVVHDFATNRKEQGPASAQDGGGLERPIAVRFNPAGDALYVVDFGVLAMSDRGPSVRKSSGALWRITRTP